MRPWRRSTAALVRKSWRMFEAGHPTILNASDIGHVAMRAIRDLGRTRVGAVFQSSFYLESSGPWVCVTGQTADMGPLSVRVDAPGSTDWRDCGISRGTDRCR